jgi:DNA-binding SARP family transcriptional activator
MPNLQFHLFGKFAADCDEQPLKGLDASKDQELLSFLLIRSNQHHGREALAAMLWGDNSTERSKKYLRQSLWHLQAILDSVGGKQPAPLLIEHDWLRVNPANPPWCDVGEFEKAVASAEGIPGKQLTDTQAGILKSAVAQYRGDLLAGWYQDWVLFERERLQNKYLLLLDKLISYSQSHQEYEFGQSYAATILRYDPARERTHRELMRLYYLAGDRTAALRQYDRCVLALKRELGVKPERHTVNLYERIKLDRFDPSEPNIRNSTETSAPVYPDEIGRLKQIQRMLSAVQRRIQREIKAAEGLPRAEKEKL